MILNGSLKIILSALSILLVIAGAAVGYGGLAARTVENAARITQLETQLEQAKRDPSSSSVGQTLLGRISELERRILVLETQVDVLRTLRARQP